MTENHTVEMEEAYRQRGCWRALLGGVAVSRIWTHRALCSFRLGKQAQITRRRHGRITRASPLGHTAGAARLGWGRPRNWRGPPLPFPPPLEGGEGAL